jgi:hypothetical protein
MKILIILLFAFLLSSCGQKEGRQFTLGTDSLEAIEIPDEANMVFVTVIDSIPINPGIIDMLTQIGDQLVNVNYISELISSNRKAKTYIIDAKYIPPGKLLIRKNTSSEIGLIVQYK